MVSAWPKGWPRYRPNGALAVAQFHDKIGMEKEMRMMDDDEMWVWCETAGDVVLVCECGPHEQCPEHLLNCILGGDSSEQFG
jgi:hypothetical protein